MRVKKQREQSSLGNLVVLHTIEAKEKLHNVAGKGN